MDNRTYVAGVDFGSSNLVMAVGSVNEKTKQIKVEALLSRPSDGIEMGVIQNVNNVCEVLRDMKREIESELGIRVDEAYAGVSGAFIHYHSYSDHVFVNDSANGIVSQTDVDALNDRMNRVTVHEDEVVMDRFPLNYVLDNRRETDKPVGAFSRQLSSTFAFIVGKKQPLSRIEMVFHNTGIRLAGIFANSVVVAEAVLSPDEKNDGAAVVDIGSDTTDVAVYNGGIVRYAATIPMGGKAIDGDIKMHGVAMRNIEDLKMQFGVAISENVSETAGISIKTAGKVTKTIMKRNLAAIIEARLMDIINYVKTEIKDSGYESKLPYGLVLTGGTSSIPEIDRLFARHTGSDVRVALATEGIEDESSDKVDSPESTAVIALLLSGAKKRMCDIEYVGGGRVQQSSTVEPEPNVEKVKVKSAPAEPQQPVREPQPRVTVDGPRIGEAKTFVPKPGPTAPVPRPEQKPVTSGAGVQTPETTVKVVPPQPAEPDTKGVETAGPTKPVEPPKPPKPKKWGFGRLIESLNGIFQDGGDLGSFDDTSLDSVADENRPVVPKSTFRPKSKDNLGGGFYVEGEDKEEI